MHTTAYFLLWVGFIDDVDHGTIRDGVAKLTYLDSAFTSSESELILESDIDNEKGDESDAEWLSGSETGLIPAPYNFEPASTE